MLSIGALAAKVFGTSNDRRLRAYRPNVEAINALEGELEQLSDAELRARTEDCRKQRADRPPPPPPLSACARFRHRSRGGQAHAWPTALRRPADRRHGTAPRQDLGNED